MENTIMSISLSPMTSVLILQESQLEKPIYYVKRFFKDSEMNYSKVENIAYSSARNCDSIFMLICGSLKFQAVFWQTTKK